MSNERAPTSVLITMAMLGAVSLVLQISLSRILSVTVSYHAAFAVIALVMLGLAASATSVFVRSSEDPPPDLADATRMLERCGLVLSFGTVAWVWLGAIPWGPIGRAVLAVTAGGLFFAGFWLVGWVVAFLLGRFHTDVARVYWSDLTGAALGCLITVPLLDSTSAPNVVVLCGAASAVAATVLARGEAPSVRSRARTVLALVAVLAGVALLAPGVTGLRVAKDQSQRDNYWVEWNHLTRVNVTDRVPQREQAIELLEAADPNLDATWLVDRWSLGWGMSPRYDGPVPTTRWVQLDADAGTQIIEGGPSRVGRELPFLEADVTSAGHHVVRDRLERAFVIGGGGGRDLLCALHFGADEVVVAELNPSVVRAVDEVFAEFSGKPYSLPSVDLRVGEARSILTRTPGDFDLVQMSMIDTWASSMAGSMVLSENALYTREAFGLFLEKLAADGVLSVSRWYHPDNYGETARVLVLMRQALLDAGVTEPGRHVAAVVAKNAHVLQVSTLLMKRSPFTDRELATLRRWADEMAFTVIHPAAKAPLDVEALLADGPAAIDAGSFDLSPPTDDRPFFFDTRSALGSWIEAAMTGDPSRGSRSSLRIGLLTVVLLALSRLLVWSPLVAHERRKPEAERTRVRDHLAAVGYFAGIGLGFAWIEIAVIQRYIVFLGHPTYALSVVLFALLLFGALGSAASARLPEGGWRATVAAVVAGALITAFLVPSLTTAAIGWPTVARIGLATALVAPLGFVMGTMYPLGVRMLERDGVPELVPWVWAINGIGGVFASTLGMLAAMSLGYTAVLVLGVLAYGLTAFAASRGFVPTRQV